MPSSRGGDLYLVLGVDAHASQAEIRAAYRSRAWRLHPDRSREADAHLMFQRVNDAYATLSDPHRRAAYDRELAAGERWAPPRAAGPQPICCSECGRATAQPRILAFQTVTSFLVWYKRSFVEGIFCADCARRTALQASMVCARRGWWSPPGAVLTVIAIVTNALGGARKPASDQKLLLLNASAFLARNKTSLAYALARQVSLTAEPPLAFEARNMMTRLKALGAMERTPRLTDPWRPSLPHLVAHALLALSAPAALAGLAVFVWIGRMTAPFG